MQHKASKFRMFPTEEQAEIMWKTIGCARFMYNQILADRSLYHELYEDGVLSKAERNSLQKASTPAFYKGLDEDDAENYYGRRPFDFLKSVDSLALANAQRNAETAYKNFFSHGAGYPNFKSKDTAKWSYKTNAVYHRDKRGNLRSNVFIKDSYLNLPKVGLVKINKHRGVYGKLKNATIVKERSGKWYVSLLFEDSHDKHLPHTSSIVGVDMNLNDIVLSDGTTYEVPNFTKNNSDDLTYRQRIFSRSQKALQARRDNGETLDKYHIKNYQEKREKVAHVHARTAAQRLDFLNKVTTDIVKNHDIICVETLKVKNLMKNRKLAKNIANASWGTFVQLLEQKCQSYGKMLVKIDQFFASTQLCSHCGMKGGPKGYRGLKVREWACSCCNTRHNRDVNAALNIRDEGCRVLVDEVKNNSREEPLVLALGLLDCSSNSQDYDTSEPASVKECCSVSIRDKRTKNYQLV